MKQNEWSIDLSGIAVIVGIIMFGIFMCFLVKDGQEIDIEKEKTKQLEIQLQIEQEKSK